MHRHGYDESRAPYRADILRLEDTLRASDIAVANAEASVKYLKTRLTHAHAHADVLYYECKYGITPMEEHPRALEEMENYLKDFEYALDLWEKAIRERSATQKQLEAARSRLAEHR